MSELPNIRVRYCGGCNPRYDRVAAVERVKKLLVQRPAAADASPEPLDLVVCGCDTACVWKRADKENPCAFKLTSAEGVDKVIGDMATLLTEKNSHC